jgi:putative phosphoribosyl transferase
MAPEQHFADRAEAGRVLASRLAQYAGRSDVLVLALPRGGLPVAFEVAQALDAPLDVFVVRKLGAPGQEELAMGAVAAGGVRVENQRVLRALGISREQLDQVAEKELREVESRQRQYRGQRAPPRIDGRTIILIDDGLATGATMAAAVQALRRLRPSRLVVAVPVASPESCENLRPLVDELVCARTPPNFVAVGQWYDNFTQTSDEEVRDLLGRAKSEQLASPKSEA